MVNEISFSEVKKHKSNKSLWIVIHNDVYDVTSYLEEHPGGEEVLLEVGGKDGTQNFEDVGHSEDARELLKKYKIGSIPASEQKKDIPQNCQKKIPKCGHKEPLKPTAERRVDAVVVPYESNTLKWALLALAGALIIGIVLKKTMS